ncbi:MAG: hypothetical protein LQ342_000826 [Letrouitia transgressa]|nr:MAG: hypothetical protein LQ342_000826 [Letrouitia transgressa]
MSSIENDHERQTAESSAEHTGLDGSAGSDTDTGRPLTSDSTNRDASSEGQHHARSNSIRRPATFKAVSVTKNFLAKAGTTASPAVKGAVENGNSAKSRSRGTTLTQVASSAAATTSNSTPSVARPRLVAKSASGQQASTPKSSGSGFRNGGASGPDPMQVWNRNRPAAPAPPKHFTDEELKQQYGIHLATRLQADGDGKEAKWADIDDDEDDWAPETIEWNDGTKITLANSDPTAIEAEEQAAAQAAKEKQEAEEKSKIPPPKSTTSVGPNATVLRLGQSSQPKSVGNALKASAEKPTLVAKPAASAPVKSPWASVPPIDKVPPVQINPPTQAPTSRPQQVDPQRPDVTSPSPSVAMEIAADSFSRARRDSPNAPPGQLFNSQSGQYETVNTGRRGSVRKDQNFRPPSVLQRPPPSDQRGAAEPSAAFQTHRTSNQQEVEIWTRRGSSTVSGESGPFGRRTSMSKGADLPRISSELLQQRRDSQPLQSPALPNGQPLDPVSASASPQQQRVSLIGSAAKGHTVEEVQAQKRLMQEKRELAVKRRQEEDAREEAAKRERIRIMMEKKGLAPLPEKGSTNETQTKRDAENQKQDEVTNMKEKNDDSRDLASKISVQPPEKPAIAPRSPPKPPLPDSSGEPKQYGMIKVHGPPLPNGVQHTSDSASTAEKSRLLTSSSPKHQTEDEPRPKSGVPSPVPMVNGNVERKRQEPQTAASPDPRPSQIRIARQQPWSNMPKDAESYASWNGTGMTTHSSSGGNLWAAPSNYKALGNGTFDRSVQRPRSSQSFYQDRLVSPAPPQPIGPPKPQHRARQSPDSVPSPEISSVPISMPMPVHVPAPEDAQTIPTSPPSEGQSKAHVRSQELGSDLQQPHPSVNTTAPQHNRISPERNVQRPDQINSTLAAWSNFHFVDAERNRQAAEKHLADLGNGDRVSGRVVHQLQPVQETWRQISDSNGQRQVIGVSKRQTGADLQPQPANGDLRIPSLTNGANLLPPNSVTRGSRFFPAIGNNIQGYNQRAVSLPIGVLRPASPPPPEASNHPAYEGNSIRPLVNLPIFKPKPTVKLPPSLTTPTQSPVIAHVNPLPLRTVSQPLVNNPTWQDRFDGLLRVKPPVPERKSAEVADFSVISKVPLSFNERTVQRASASVMLPPTLEDLDIARDAGKVTSKDSEDEEALFENREFGSLPPISIPTKAPDSIGFQEVAVRPRRLTRAALNKPFESESKRAIEFDIKDDQVAEGTLIFIGLPGASRKSKTLPRAKGQGPYSSSQRQRHVSTNTKSSKGPKSRESSGNYNPKHMQTGSHKASTHGFHGPQPRNQHRSKSDWYNRNPNLPNQTANLIPT